MAPTVQVAQTLAGIASCGSYLSLMLCTPCPLNLSHRYLSRSMFLMVLRIACGDFSSSPSVNFSYSGIPPLSSLSLNFSGITLRARDG